MRVGTRNQNLFINTDRAGEPEPLEKKNQEPQPEPLKKKQEPEPQKICHSCTSSQKIRSIRKLYICYSSLGKIKLQVFMVKSTIILLICSFTLKAYGEKYFIKLNKQLRVGARAGAACFWPLGAGAACKKNEEPEPLEIKRGAGTGK